MKKFLFPIGLLACAAAGASAQTVVLSGTLTANRTLNADSCYHMQGCFVVPNGFTLNIPAGTEIRCQAASNLVVERGGMINATGTANAPIVFTSDQPIGSRAPGDWGGLVVLGNAANNESVNAIRNVCVNRLFGGSIANDNSGTLQYVRIEFAGDATDRDDPAGLLLASVGSGTTIDHIQVSESGHDGIRALGGTYNAKHLLVLNAYQNDFSYSLGNVSKQQFLLGLRMDADAHHSSGSNGMVIENDPGGSAASPLTGTTISNLSLAARGYCNQSLDPDIQYGIKFGNNGAGNIWNSAIAGYRLEGLFLADAGSIANTSGNPGLLNFSFNSLMDNQSPQYAAGTTWTGACGANIASWITGATMLPCRESDNNFSLSSFGYHASICEDYCEDRPTLTSSGSSLIGTDYSGAFSDAFFDSVGYRGAIGATDWTLDWARFCPQQEAYCPIEELKSSAADPIQLIPNPASSSTQVLFEAATTGQAIISLMDAVSGRVLQEVAHRVTEPGSQRVTLTVKGLREGVYTIRVAQKDVVQYGQLSVR